MKSKEIQQRCSGILLHPTSLPSKYGIGDLGIQAYKFIDYLQKYGQTLWQILPLGPTGYGNSPYQCFSAFAGNSLLISPQKLVEMNIVAEHELPPIKVKDKLRIDYESVIAYKEEVVDIAFDNFCLNIDAILLNNFREFLDSHGFWLDEYALFMSLKKANNMRPWNEWADSFKQRETTVIEQWREEKKTEIERVKFTQFLFFTQWKMLKDYAKHKHVKLVGDIPIFVAYDSVDVWSNPEMYYLDEKMDLLYVAGVPPDYFSTTGQRWGNPLYRWAKMKKNGFKWWIKRIKHNLEQVDILRIDHFRGFESYWQIDADEETAEKGKWILGPGLELFQKIFDELGDLPIIAEDLGIITPEVESMLQGTGFPGMNVLQFAFGEDEDEYTENKYLPHNIIENSVVYTATHDNQTTLAWFESLSTEEQDEILEYTKTSGEDIVGDLIKLAWESAANMAIIPFQDLLRLGSEARMNVPGTTGNNWEWRFSWNKQTEETGKEILHLTSACRR